MTARARLMVINDQREQLRLLSQILKLAGHQVLAFQDPTCALQCLQERGPVDLIITDLNMPQLNGWELCSRLRSPELARHNATPILVVSATFAGLQREEVRLELGVNDFLPVPYNAEQLRRKVADILAGFCPKAYVRALFIGFLEDEPEIACFRRFGYEVATARNLESSLEVMGSQPFEILIYRGELGDAEARLLFSPSSQLLCSIWVRAGGDPELTMAISEMGVHCVPPDCRGEQLIRICENARQQSCLRRVRDLLEERTQQLLASDQKYYTLFQSIPSLVLCLSEGGQVLDINEAGCALLGCSRQQVVGRSFLGLVAEAYQVPFQVSLHETLLYGHVHYELQLRGDLEPITAEVHQRQICLDGERRILAIAHDVTERRHYQEAVKASDTRYRIVAENTYDWEFWLSPRGSFLFSSPSAEKMTGYSSLDFEDNPNLLPSIVLEEDRARFESQWKIERPEDLPKDFDFRVRRADGQVRWLNHVSLAVFDSQGHFLGSRGSHRDVTEKRLIDEERARLIAAIEQIADPLLITDPVGRIHYANRAFLGRLTGSPKQTSELAGDSSWQRAHGEILEAMARGQGWSGAYSRSNRQIEASVSPVRDSSGQINSFVWVERDVTEERLLAEQLRHAQKMEAIGTLAGGIAHDFNNLLAGILGCTDLLKVHGEGQPDIEQSAEVIEKTARRAAELTQKLLGFARRGKHQNVVVPIHGAIDNCIELLRRTVDKRIEIVRSFQARRDLVMGDPTQMEQVFLNLAINARDAIENQGRILFSTRQETVKASSEQPAPGEYLVVSVSDNGCGISGDISERIFEPFFTTKVDGKGTGMGLAMVYGIVRNHGGVVRMESQPGQGADFHVWLPLTQAAVNGASEARSRQPVKGSGRILVVDDEDLLREVACRLLKHLGYQVAAAADGCEACEYYERHHAEVDLVIVDMIMPRLGGAECFRRMKQINPAVRAVLSTGYTLNESAQELLDEGMVGFIQKPYHLNQLSEVLARALVG